MGDIGKTFPTPLQDMAVTPPVTLRLFPLPEAVLVAIRRLEGGGFKAYLVGGSVRDFLLGHSPKDFDIATDAKPEQVLRLFASYKTIPTGLKHGTVTVLLDGLPLEITTFRVEGPYSDHRHPDSVAFSHSLGDDLARRDFTINALAYHPRQGLIDYFGGVADIEKGVIRAVGNAGQRFEEDALRLLRGLRFSSQFGFELAPDTAEGMRREKELLRFVAVERLSREFDLLLCGRHVLPVLLHYEELLAVLLPELLPAESEPPNPGDPRRTLWPRRAKRVSFCEPTVVLRLAALFAGGGASGTAGAAVCDACLRRLRYPNALRERVVLLLRYFNIPIPPETERTAIHRALLKMGDQEAFFQLLALKKADLLTQERPPVSCSLIRHLDKVEQTAHELLAEKPCLSVADLAINGRDLLALGFRGPEIGVVLRHLLEETCGGRIENRPDCLRAAAQKLFPFGKSQPSKI